MPLTLEVRQKLSKVLKGKVPWNKNIETGLTPKSAFKKGHIPWNKNKKNIYSPEVIEILRKKCGHLSPWNKGKSNCYNVDTIEKLRQACFRRFENIENHPRWQGGKSLEPYPIEFSRQLRIKIKKRDYYICQLCGKNANDSFLHVHHIDYNKNNNSLINLITLCNSCHTKTNSQRNNWQIYFQNSINTAQLMGG